MLICLRESGALYFKHELKTENICCPRIGPCYIKDGEKHRCITLLISFSSQEQIAYFLTQEAVHLLIHFKFLRVCVTP